MKNVRKIEDIATKMRLMGDSVEILTESTLIQTPKNGLAHLYKLVDNRLVLSCKYHEIKRVDGADICITKSITGKYGIISLNGHPIIRPGYLNIDDSYKGMLIVTLDNGLKSILNYKGDDLIPYTLYSLKIINTAIGDIIDTKSSSIYAGLLLIKQDANEVTLEKLYGINKEIGCRSYSIEYNKIIVFYDAHNKFEIPLTNK